MIKATRRWIRTALERIATQLGWRLSKLTAEEKRYLSPSSATSPPLDVASQEWLRRDHPQLQELRDRYARSPLPVALPSLWQQSFLARDLDLTHFRGDNPYVWQFRQLRSAAILKYYLLLDYVESSDALGLIGKLEEDGSFGCWTFDFHRRAAISRDLLDSVNEINFLQRHLGIAERTGLRVLDIGAGYGRLAHRMTAALPNLDHYYCLDAVPESTFLCDFYLQHRQCAERASAVPLDRIEELVPAEGLPLAVNIHSFSECTLAAITWWVEWLAARGVENLLIVPNEPDELLSMESDGSRHDFLPLLNRCGYQLRVQEPVITDPDIRRLTSIGDQYYLFALSKS